MRLTCSPLHTVTVVLRVDHVSVCEKVSSCESKFAGPAVTYVGTRTVDYFVHKTE